MIAELIQVAVGGLLMVSGDGCIVVTDSIITKGREPYRIYTGSTAKKMKKRFETNAGEALHRIKLIPVLVSSQCSSVCSNCATSPAWLRLMGRRC